jgi:hypothetical protein
MFSRKTTTYLTKVRKELEDYLVTLDDSHDLVYPNGDYVKVGESGNGYKYDKLYYYTAELHEDHPARLELRDSNSRVTTTPTMVRVHENGHKAYDFSMHKGDFFAKGSDAMLVCPTMKADFEKAFEDYVAAHPFPKKRKAKGTRRNSRRNNRSRSRRNSRKH